MPALLRGLEDKVWRTKQGSVQLLGAMAHCAPRQLGACLPTIVPRLSEVLSDPHPKVQASAQQALDEVRGQRRRLAFRGGLLLLLLLWAARPALRCALLPAPPLLLGGTVPTTSRQITPPNPKTLLQNTSKTSKSSPPSAPPAPAQVGSVIGNPEVQRLVPALLAAIADPNGQTKACLDTLLSTKFINTIDAPSLALIIPVVHRGLKDRAGDVKKRAARIVGSMCSLINEPKARGRGF